MLAAIDLPQREILWNVPPALMNAVYLLSAVCVGWIIWWFRRRASLWQLGRAAETSVTRIAGWRRLTEYLLTHRVLRRDRYAGMMHALIFWGFVVLLIATTLVGIEHHFHFVFLTGPVYLVFSLGADLGGAAFCVGIGMALWRRRNPESHGRLLADRSTTGMLWGLLILALSGFLVEGLRIARDFPPFEIWSPIGYATAKVLSLVGITAGIAETAHRSVWIGHAVLVLGFFVVVPLTLLRHIILGAYSVSHPYGRPGSVSPVASNLGHSVELADFRRLDLIQADACLTCGRCSEVCPAKAAGKPLDPRSIVLGLREGLDHPGTSLGDQVGDDSLWSCTTCSACDAACPVSINVVEKIVSFRRGRVSESNVPESAANSLESTVQKFNPFGSSNSSRMEWAVGLDVSVAKDDEPVELLYWVGCAGAFDPAGREVSRAVIILLNHLKINYRVLGCQERCTGDPARRMGEEELWKELATWNQQLFSTHGVRTILTQCAHCFNTLQNEYTDIGPMPEIIHHSQWLREHLDSGALQLEANSNETITYHDPCYLARSNGETQASRDVLDRLSSGNRVEMDPCGQSGFCCGGGGGQLWLDVRGSTRVETIRASHVEATEARTVATACPYCRVMLEAGREGLPDDQGHWRVKDISELVVENLKT
jgi:Fe-S oxidoreductase